MGALLPAMTQQKLDTQRDVVKNERRWSMDNQPYGSWMEKLPALCFPSEHPFHHSLMGSMEDLDGGEPRRRRAVLRDVLHAGQRGALDCRRLRPERRAAACRAAFRTIPRGGRKPPLPDMSLPPVFGQWKREVVPDDVMLPRLFLAFRSPAFGTAAVLSRRACAGRSSACATGAA